MPKLNPVPRYSNSQAALSGAFDDDADDPYFPNIRLKIQDLAHAMRRCAGCRAKGSCRIKGCYGWQQDASSLTG